MILESPVHGSLEAQAAQLTRHQVMDALNDVFHVHVCVNLRCDISLCKQYYEYEIHTLQTQRPYMRIPCFTGTARRSDKLFNELFKMPCQSPVRSPTIVERISSGCAP